MTLGLHSILSSVRRVRIGASSTALGPRHQAFSRLGVTALVLSLAVLSALVSSTAFAQRVGEQVWVDLEADRPENDGYAEGLAISLRPGLIEVQASRVTMTGQSDLAGLLRRGNAFVPAPLVSPLDVGRRTWQAKQLVLTVFRQASEVAFLPASPELTQSLRSVADPRHKGRLRDAQLLLTLLHALVEPRGNDAGLIGESLEFANQGWRVAAQAPNLEAAIAFDGTAISVLRRASGMIKQLGGASEIETPDRLAAMFSQPGWAGELGDRRRGSEVARRTAHLVARSISARTAVADIGDPERVVEAVRTLPQLMAAIEDLHPEAIGIVKGSADRAELRKEFLAKLQDEMVAIYRGRVQATSQVDELRRRYLGGEDAALELWWKELNEQSAILSRAIRTPVFEPEFRDHLVEERRVSDALAAARASEQKRADDRAAEQKKREDERIAALTAAAVKLQETWTARVQCNDGFVPLDIEITPSGPAGRIRAIVSTPGPYADNPDRAAMEGTTTPDARRVQLQFIRWIQIGGLPDPIPPLIVSLASDGQSLEGTVGRCQPFKAERKSAAVSALIQSLPGRWTGNIRCGSESIPVALEVRPGAAAAKIVSVLSFGEGQDQGQLELQGALGAVGQRITSETTRWFRRPDGAQIDGAIVEPISAGQTLEMMVLPRSDRCAAVELRRR
jgi:hypothetical protein